MSRIAIMNYMAQDRPDLPVTERVMSQKMAKPTFDTECLKRTIRHLSSQGILMFPHGKMDKPLRVWTDSDRDGVVLTRRSCSGGYISVTKRPYTNEARRSRMLLYLRGRPD